MLRSTVLFSSIISMALLTGCASTYYLDGNDYSVTFRGERTEAFKQAREHCGFYEKATRLAETIPDRSIEDCWLCPERATFTFHCIER